MNMSPSRKRLTASFHRKNGSFVSAEIYPTGMPTTDEPMKDCLGRDVAALCPRRFILAILLVLAVALGRVSAHAQQDGAGRIDGIVFEAGTGAPLSGVIVTVRGTTLGTQTDSGGRYRIENVPPGSHELRVSKSGYERTSIADVAVIAGQSTKADARIAPEYFEAETFEVIADPVEDQSAILLEERQFASQIVDSLGSEFFSQAGANDAADIISKVTGATVVGGKYVFIRGLGERYSNTTLNGSHVPSADPDKRAVQMDIFPAQAIDSVVTSKTFTPDQPGDFSGGSVDIRTKRFPDEFYTTLSGGFTYNTRASFVDEFLSYDGGGFDWAALDDGTRELPDGWKDPNAARPGTRAALLGPQAEINRLIDLSLEFSPSIWPERDKSAVDHSGSFAMGDKMELFGRTLGYMFGVNYDRDYDFYKDGITGRYSFDGNLGAMRPIMLLDDTRAIETVSLGSLVNLAYQIHDDHLIAYNFLYNRNSDNEARIQSGFLDNAGSDEFVTGILHWTERDLRSHQVRGEHRFPQALDWKTDWTASFASTTQAEPDFRVFSFQRADDGSARIARANYPAPTRFFRDLEERNVNLKLDNEIPYDVRRGLEGNVRFGVYSSDSERAYRERRFEYASQNGFAHFDDPLTFLADENFNHQQRRLNLYAIEPGFNNYDGSLEVQAGYLMTELPIIEKLRLIGGVRYELSELRVTNSGDAVESAPNKASFALRNDNPLPALSMTYEIVPNMNVRLAYGQTLARPTFREIALVPSFDFANGEILVGNPNLKQTSIDNFDLRWEWFPRPSEVLAAGVFYKDLRQPIEKTIVNANRVVQFQNREVATVYGLELEARKNLDFITDILKPFTIGGNFAYIKSEVDVSSFENVGIPDRQATRPLAGQSEFIVNFDLTYNNEDTGTMASVFLNIFGERLSAVSRVGPNVFEQPVSTLDFTLSQRLRDGLKLKFGARNLLDPKIEETQQIGGQEFVYSSYRKGRELGLSLSYDF